MTAVSDHAKLNYFPPTKWTSQFYSGPFQDFGIKISKNERRRYPNNLNGKTYTGTFILGVDLKEIITKKIHDSDSEAGFDDGEDDASPKSIPDPHISISIEPIKKSNIKVL